MTPPGFEPRDLRFRKPSAPPLCLSDSVQKQAGSGRNLRSSPQRAHDDSKPESTRAAEARLLEDSELRAVIAARLSKHTVRGEGCWLWQRARNSQGYGQMAVHRRTMSTHRVAYVLEHGAIPDGLLVLHRCDVRRCINPAHLFLGTTADNSADMVAKGRQAHGERNPRARLSDADVATIRARCAAGESRASVARAFGVSGPYVSTLALGQYRAGGAR